MAVIVFNRLPQLVTDYVLEASGSITPPASWQMALATLNVSSFARNSIISVTVAGSNVNEIGSGTQNGYARKTINKDATGAGWGASSLPGGGSQVTGAQVSFSFTGTPAPGATNSWFLSDGTTINAGQLYFAGDTAATRNFANGDTEKVTPTLLAG